MVHVSPKQLRPEIQDQSQYNPKPKMGAVDRQSISR